jgi:hypothetical protein
MRRALILKAALGLSVLCLPAGLPAPVAASPVVTLKAKGVPIPIDPSNPHSATYSGTGAILGAPTGLQVAACFSTWWATRLR